MANILYMAISRDGFIAGSADETPWSDAEWQSFQEFAKSCDLLLLGKRTFEIMKAGGEFVDGPRYTVVTNDQTINTFGLNKIAINTAADMPSGGKIGIIGGGELNGRLAKLGVIDEIILDIEPVDLGEGIRLFGDYDIPLKLELIGSTLIGKSTIQRHYRVAK
jgi:dihydrofolate reductase